MKPIALLLAVAFFSLAAAPVHTSTPPAATSGAPYARGVGRLVNDIEALYKAAYRPAKGVRWQEVLAVRYQHRKLQIIYRVRDRKEIVYYDVRQVAPRSRFAGSRSFVYDSKTGKDIFAWLQRKDDAAILRQDIEQLRAMLEE